MVGAYNPYFKRIYRFTFFFIALNLKIFFQMVSLYVRDNPNMNERVQRRSIKEKNLGANNLEVLSEIAVSIGLSVFAGVVTNIVLRLGNLIDNSNHLENDIKNKLKFLKSINTDMYNRESVPSWKTKFKMARIKVYALVLFNQKMKQLREIYSVSLNTSKRAEQLSAYPFELNKAGIMRYVSLSISKEVQFKHLADSKLKSDRRYLFISHSRVSDCELKGIVSAFYVKVIPSMKPHNAIINLIRLFAKYLFFVAVLSGIWYSMIILIPGIYNKYGDGIVLVLVVPIISSFFSSMIIVQTIMISIGCALAFFFGKRFIKAKKSSIFKIIFGIFVNPLIETIYESIIEFNYLTGKQILTN